MIKSERSLFPWPFLCNLGAFWYLTQQISSSVVSSDPLFPSLSSALPNRILAWSVPHWKIELVAHDWRHLRQCM